APDEVSRLRQQDALRRAASADGDRLAELRAVLLGEREPEFADAGRAGGMSPPSSPEHPALVNGASGGSCPPLAKLNEPQLDAVHFALSAKDLAVIHGPPGT